VSTPRIACDRESTVDEEFFIDAFEILPGALSKGKPEMKNYSSTSAGVTLTYARNGLSFVATEVDDATLQQHARRLRDWYNAAENASMMGGATDTEDTDVLDFVRDLRASGGHWFLLFVDGAPVGDMDLRSVTERSAEFAIMVGDTARKGQGLGATFATMLHVFAFRDLALERIYVQPKRENVRVQRLERSLGYEPDDSPEARSHADDGDDVVTMSIAADVFRGKHPSAWEDVVTRST
jgi:RimJ/RimL family protein N-acetyltransferase